MQFISVFLKELESDGIFDITLYYNIIKGRLAKFSSPPELRHRMDKDMPKALRTSMMPPEFRGVQDIRKLKAFDPYKDVVSCAMDTSRARTPAPPGYYAEPQSFLETRVSIFNAKTIRKILNYIGTDNA